MYLRSHHLSGFNLQWCQVTIKNGIGAKQVAQVKKKNGNNRAMAVVNKI